MIQFPFELDNPWVLFFDGLIAVLLVLYLIRYLVFFRDTKKWKYVNGFIEECKFLKGSINDETSDRISVIYSYEVNGKKYHGTKISSSEHILANILFSQNPFIARKINRLFKSASNIVVYYSESNPEVSCLDISFDKRAFIIMAICSTCFIGFLIFFGLR